MACNFNCFIKITRSFGSGFQSQNIAKPEVRLIMTDNKSERTFLPDPIRKHFWFWIADSTFHCLLLFFFSIVSIMFILIMSVALMAWPSRNPDTVSCSYSYSLRRGNIYCCMLSFWGHADPWIFSVSALTVLISATYLFENSILP